MPSPGVGKSPRLHRGDNISAIQLLLMLGPLAMSPAARGRDDVLSSCASESIEEREGLVDRQIESTFAIRVRHDMRERQKYYRKTFDLTDFSIDSYRWF